MAIRAQLPLEVMSDVIQPFPTFSEAFLHALTELGAEVPARGVARMENLGASVGWGLAVGGSLVAGAVAAALFHAARRASPQR